MLWIFLSVGAGYAMVILITIIFDIIALEFAEILKKLFKSGISLAIGLVGLLGILGISSMSYQKEEQSVYWEINELPNIIQISKDINDKTYYIYISDEKNETYSFWYKEEDGGIKYRSIDIKATTIYEDNDETPHIIQYTYNKKNTMNKVLRDILAFGFGESSKKRYEIVIPEGTILKMIK